MRWLALLLALGGCDLVFEINTPGVPDEITFVQTFARAADGFNRAAVPFLNPTQAGSLIIVGVDWTATDVDITKVSDSQGNALVPVGDAVANGALTAQLFYAADTAGGAEVVDVELSGIADSFEIYLHEYAGVATRDPFDQVAVNVGNGGGPVDSGMATLDSPGELLFAYAVDGSVTPGEGFTARSTFHDNLTQDRISGVPGPYTATATVSSGFTFITAGFRAATKR